MTAEERKWGTEEVSRMRIAPEVLAVLSQCSVAGNAVHLPPVQLERKLYVRVNEVLEALGGKWNRKAKAHLFERDPAERLDDAIVTGEVDRPADFGFFQTPPELAARVQAEADVRPGMRVLEPSAGHGALICGLAGVDVVAVELLPDNVRVLQGLHGKIGLASALTVVAGDFIGMSAGGLGGPFDRVLMNPPFSRQQDIAHVLHAFSMLRPGGRLVSIMSGGVAFRQDRRTVAFRAEVAQHGGSIEPLPDGSFRSSGTDVRTVLVTMER
jgi:predicted RNA methylase